MKSHNLGYYADVQDYTRLKSPTILTFTSTNQHQIIKPYIHGSPVTGGWAEAVMVTRSLEIMGGRPTNRPTQWPIGRVARDKDPFLGDHRRG